MKFIFLLIVFLSLHPLSANAGYIEREAKIGGYVRSYLMYRPAVPVENMPVLIAYHGRFGDPKRFDQQTRLAEFANRHKFILILPKADGDVWRDSLYAPNTIENDIVFTDKIIEFLNEDENIDLTRIYATGMSGGGFMAQNYACRGEYPLAGIAVAAAAMPIEKSRHCKQQSLDVIYVHGDKDNFTERGGGIYKSAPYFSTEDSVKFWADMNGCTGKNSITAKGADKKDATSVILTTYAPCKNGKKVVYYNILGAGHTWPGSPYKYGGDTGIISRAINMTAVVSSMVSGR